MKGIKAMVAAQIKHGDGSLVVVVTVTELENREDRFSSYWN